MSITRMTAELRILQISLINTMAHDLRLELWEKTIPTSEVNSFGPFTRAALAHHAATPR
jgi:hypothetical protein